jgi:Nuclease-related domain
MAERERRAGRGAENRGLDFQIQGLAVALAACIAAITTSALVPGLTLVTLGPLVACFWLALRRYRAGDSWMRGSAGERAVGIELEALEPLGWRTVHDVMKPTGGNVDHVVAGPGGVFAIETKLHVFGKAGIRQAHAHARYLKKVTGAEVRPVICLANRNAAPKRYANVWCMGKPHLAAFLTAQPISPAGPGVLDPLT